jgi:hypothetical protein
MKYALIALVVGLGACDDGSSDSGDTAIGTTTGGNTTLPPELVSYLADCTDADTYVGTLTTTSATNGGAVLNLWDDVDTPCFAEEHMLVSDTATDDELAITLHTTTDIADLDDNGNGTGDEHTLFSCADAYQFLNGNLTLALRIYDTDNSLSQCCAFGNAPEEVAAASYCTIGGAPSNPDELNGCNTSCAGL